MPIEVDPGALGAAAQALRQATSVAREVHRGTLALTEAAAATGSPRLFFALEGFRHTWAYGLGLVVDDADTLATMLGQAAKVYADTDGAIAQACRP
jgi:predicted component of type VI protein secretion system